MSKYLGYLIGAALTVAITLFSVYLAVSAYNLLAGALDAFF